MIKKNAAYTLVEVLIAVAIFTILVMVPVALYILWHFIAKFW